MDRPCRCDTNHLIFKKCYFFVAILSALVFVHKKTKSRKNICLKKFVNRYLSIKSEDSRKSLSTDISQNEEQDKTWNIFGQICQSTIFSLPVDYLYPIDVGP